MGLFLINILALFLLLNFKFGDTIECYKEIDLTQRNGTIIKNKLATCDTDQASAQVAEVPELAAMKFKCIKSDCGKYGYYKGCFACAGIKFSDIGIFGFETGDCTCYECDGDKCNSAGGVLSNFMIIFLFCLIIIIINGK
ncbi:unnamed protein product [Meloidogyne enterolobii]|uniref:Uncharacterized protein n=1 Tax=Meloidogyne enterolobii TaxID=390850 RepID=A0ACB0YAW0_MELEN